MIKYSVHSMCLQYVYVLILCAPSHAGGCMQDYRASIKQGKCFACNQQEMLWANFPCRHLLWCSECKWQAIWAAGDFEHKCVVCHVDVQKIDLLRWHEFCQPATNDVLSAHEFPPLDPTRIRRYDYSKTPIPADMQFPQLNLYAFKS